MGGFRAFCIAMRLTLQSNGAPALIPIVAKLTLIKNKIDRGDFHVIPTPQSISCSSSFQTLCS